MTEFVNYAHRGASAYAPENTFAAFYLGWQMGANGIETDIQCTRDGVPVLFHDSVMTRITGTAARICDLTYDELTAYDVGSYKGEQFRGERVPSLEEFLHHFARKGLQLALEIKQRNIEDSIAPLIRKYCVPEEVVVTSFQWDSLLAFHGKMPEIRTGWLSRNESEELVAAMKSAGIWQYCPNASTWTDGWHQRFREAGFSIRPWGVKDESLMARMLEMGVDGMTVNFPDKLEAARKTRHDAPKL